MFFVFPFLLLSIYFSETHNFVLNKNSQGDGQQTDKDLIFQDVRNDSSDFTTRKSVLHVIHNFTKTRSSNPKLNKFNKKLSDLNPIKRHIEENDEEDTSSIFKSTKNSIRTSTPELKRKWPVVELLSHSDDFKENSQYFDEFEKKEFPFNHDIENESKDTKNPLKLIISNLDLKNNHTKDKPVGLRSLPQQIFPGISCEDGDKCVCRLPSKTGKTSPKCTTTKKCTRTTIVYSLVNFYLPYEIVNIPTGPKSTTTPKATTTRPPGSIDFENFPVGIPVGVPMGVPMAVPMGMPAGYPAGYPLGYPARYPAGYPAGPSAYAPGSTYYYQQNIHEEVPKPKKPSKTQSNDYLYYDDDEDDGDENVCVFDEDSKKRKYDKKHKGDILIDVEYDVEERKPNRHKCRDSQEDLATDIFNDLRKSYGDTVIKDCYCSSTSSCGIQFRTVFLLLILDTFCYVSWVNGY